MPPQDSQQSQPAPTIRPLPLLDDAIEHGEHSEHEHPGAGAAGSGAAASGAAGFGAGGSSSPAGQQLSAEEIKPTWRGWIHTGIFPITIAAGIVLIALAQGPVAKWASAVYMLSSMLLFGISALYHRFNWKPKTKQMFRRFDHANIFILIAGTYTPIALLALPPEKGVLLLVLVWIGALLGIGFRIFWVGAPRWLYVPLYVLLGWAAVMYLVDIAHANLAAMVLVAVGGLLYTLGSIVYGFKRPNPVPGVFGFHEIFHALTVLAFLCHWTAALLLALDPFYLR